MKVVLNKDIKGIGKKLDIVEVSEGYARNYLLPRKIATIADNKSLSETKTKLEAKQFKKNTEIEIAKEIEKKFNIKIDKKKISLKSPIKEVGSYFAKIKLYEGIIADMKISVLGL